MSKFIMVKQVHMIQVPDDFDWNTTYTDQELMALGRDPTVQPIEDALNRVTLSRRFDMDELGMSIVTSGVDSMQLYNDITESEARTIVDERSVF